VASAEYDTDEEVETIRVADPQAHADEEELTEELAEDVLDAVEDELLLAVEELDKHREGEGEFDTQPVIETVKVLDADPQSLADEEELTEELAEDVPDAVEDELPLAVGELDKQCEDVAELDCKAEKVLEPDDDRHSEAEDEIETEAELDDERVQG